MAQTVLDRRRPWSRGHVLETGDHRRRLNSDVVFAMLLALALPFYPLFYGWFAFISGPTLLLSLSIFIVGAVLGFLRLPWFNQAGRLNSESLLAASQAKPSDHTLIT
jgi:hypothetical protein